MMNNLMLFIIMLGLFVQFAGENIPKILKDNKSLIMQLLWVMLFLGCFFGWKIEKPNNVAKLKLNKEAPKPPQPKPPQPKPPQPKPPQQRPPQQRPPQQRPPQQRPPQQRPPQQKEPQPFLSDKLMEGYSPL